MPNALLAELMKIQIVDLTDLQGQGHQMAKLYLLISDLTPTVIMLNLVELL